LKIIITILFIYIFLNADDYDTQWEGRIIAKILDSISNENIVNVYTKNKRMLLLIKDMENIHVNKLCDKADIILSSQDKNVSCTKPSIVFNYKTYLHNSNAVGVFFWQKGRPTIRFSSSRLGKFHLKVRGELTRFVTQTQ